MLTEEELLRDYNFKRTQLEEQEDELRHGERSLNTLIEQASDKISRMIQEAEGDTSEAFQFSRYRLNQLTEEYNDRFQDERRQVQNQLDKAEREFNQYYRQLNTKD